MEGVQPALRKVFAGGWGPWSLGGGGSREFHPHPTHTHLWPNQVIYPFLNQVFLLMMIVSLCDSRSNLKDQGNQDSPLRHKQGY